jgi:hypothetical protein
MLWICAATVPIVIIIVLTVEVAQVVSSSTGLADGIPVGGLDG